MAGRSRMTFMKRQREVAKRQKKMEKAERRAQRTTDRGDLDSDEPEEDPDIAGIVPGPQRQPWMEDSDDSDEKPAEGSDEQREGAEES